MIRQNSFADKEFGPLFLPAVPLSPDGPPV
jgi:hypothetical protein